MERLGQEVARRRAWSSPRDDLARHRKTFRLYGLVYPFVWAATRLDALVPASGYMLIAGARRTGA